MLRLSLVGLLMGATILVGCGPDVRYDVQLELNLRAQTEVSGRAQREGWLQIIFSRSGGPWIETNHAFAVGKEDSLALRREGELVIASATGREVQLDEFRPDTDKVALAFRVQNDGGPLGALARLGLTTIQVVAISAAVVAFSLLLVVAALSGDDDDDFR